MYLYGLPVVCLYHMEVEAVYPSSRSKEDTALLVKMTANVHQDLTKTDQLNRAKLHIHTKYFNVERLLTWSK